MNENKISGAVAIKGEHIVCYLDGEKIYSGPFEGDLYADGLISVEKANAAKRCAEKLAHAAFSAFSKGFEPVDLATLNYENCQAFSPNPIPASV